MWKKLRRGYRRFWVISRKGSSVGVSRWLTRTVSNAKTIATMAKIC